MSEAPERIYLDGDVEAGDGIFPRCFENPKYVSEPPVEYVRADRIEELEAKLAKAVSFTSDVAYRATTIEHDRDEMWLLDLDVLRHERDCDITQARAALAELKGQE